LKFILKRIAFTLNIKVGWENHIMLNTHTKNTKGYQILEQIVRYHCSSCGYPNLLCLYKGKRSEDVCTKCSKTLNVEDIIAETW